jgi:hypothetical protein
VGDWWPQALHQTNRHKPGVQHAPGGRSVVSHEVPSWVPSWLNAYWRRAEVAQTISSPEILRHSRAAAAASTTLTKQSPAVMNQIINHSTDPSP